MLYLSLLLSMAIYLTTLTKVYAKPKANVTGTVMMEQFQLLAPDSYQNQTSGANLRTAGFVLQLDFQNDTKLIWDISINDSGKAKIGPLFLNFEQIENTHILVGQIPSPFCLENSNSSKWLPLLERSLPATAFQPCIGPGFGIKNWSTNTFISLAIRQPPYGWAREQKSKHPEGINDRWGGSIRAVWFPLHESQHVVQLGGSYSLQSTAKSVSFEPSAEIRTRDTLVLAKTSDMPAKGYQVYGLEFSHLWKSYQIEAEYLKNDVKRQNAKNISFDGWHIQANYILTGQSRSHSIKNGSFGSVQVDENQSAWQIAARYSTINLNADDIKGGIQDNISVALSWYINSNIRATAGYVQSKIEREDLSAANNKTTETVETAALRLQTVF